MKPGKPFAYGRIQRGVGKRAFHGLPGNPVSSFLTFAVLVRPFLLRLQGVRDVAPKKIAASRRFHAAPKADKRREFLRVRQQRPSRRAGAVSTTKARACSPRPSGAMAWWTTLLARPLRWATRCALSSFAQLLRDGGAAA
jgi:molybdopterin biosynthesis enzyme